MVTVGVFEDYGSATKAVDELVLQKVPEEAINVIASAGVSILPEVSDRPDFGKSGGDSAGSTDTLNEKLRGQSVMGIPDAGDVLASGDQAYDIVRHTSGTFDTTASLSQKLTDMGMNGDDAAKVTSFIKNGGLMVWVTDGTKYPAKAAEVFAGFGAAMTKSVSMPLPQEK